MTPCQKMGPLGWFVRGFQFDSSLHVPVVWLEKRGFLGAIQTVVFTNYAVSPKFAQVSNIILLFSKTFLRSFFNTTNHNKSGRSEALLGLLYFNDFTWQIYLKCTYGEHLTIQGVSFEFLSFLGSKMVWVQDWKEAFCFLAMLSSFFSA